MAAGLSIAYFKYFYSINIFFKIYLQVIIKGPIHNLPSLVQTMAWRRAGDTDIWTNNGLVYCLVYASGALEGLIYIKMLPKL